MNVVKPGLSNTRPEELCGVACSPVDTVFIELTVFIYFIA